jgi:hypothetical protein
VVATVAREPPGNDGDAGRKHCHGEQPRCRDEPAAASNPKLRGCRRLLLRGEAYVVLLNEALSFETEVVRVRAEEPFRIGRAG